MLILIALGMLDKKLRFSFFDGNNPSLDLYWKIGIAEFNHPGYLSDFDS